MIPHHTSAPPPSPRSITPTLIYHTSTPSRHFHHSITHPSQNTYTRRTFHSSRPQRPELHERRHPRLVSKRSVPSPRKRGRWPPRTSLLNKPSFFHRISLTEHRPEQLIWRLQCLPVTGRGRRNVSVSSLTRPPRRLCRRQPRPSPGAPLTRRPLPCECLRHGRHRTLPVSPARISRVEQ